ncbi:hypothetical protein NO004_40069 [Flavobacterium psychrophilum]|nr:hypothetical protein NO004_40069 [Flavobacterium psychrophilum]
MISNSWYIPNTRYKQAGQCAFGMMVLYQLIFCTTERLCIFTPACL